MRDALRAFGDEVYYGVKLVELVPILPDAGRLLCGRLVAPGKIVLYDQERTPWRLGSDLSPEEEDRLREAGANVEDAGIVAWPRDTLRRFMLRYVLAHELGHHVLQHKRRLRGERAARTRDHEARADVIAAELRKRLP